MDSAKERQDQAFIQKLTRLIEANLENDQFSVSDLAAQMSISHSQIHRKLKSIKNKSCSQFIREIRLEKAKKLLENGAESVSQVAFQVGFASASYFNKCFHDFYGYPPGEVRYSNVKEEKPSEDSTLANVPGRNKTRIMWLISIVVIGAVGYWIFMLVISNPKNSIQKSANPVSKSIAVMPLKNIGNDSTIQYLADGLMEDLLNRLSNVRDLKVKSRITSENYAMREMSLPEVAKSMKVAYVVEGSILKDQDNFRLYIKLMDAQKDEPIWSGKYDKKVGSLMDFVSNTSSQIVNQLQMVLDDKQKQQFEKKYTSNPEAYNLYLEGRFHWGLRGEDEIKLSIEYYNKVLELDSNFYLAYSGLADAYYILAYHNKILRSKGMEISRNYALKALKYDPNLAEAHATLGGVSKDYDFDYKKAERELRLAVQLNPNYATALQWFSEYWDMIGVNDSARYYIDNAIELNPFSQVILWQSYYYYSKQNDFENADRLSKQVYKINQDKDDFYWRCFLICLYQGRQQEAFENYLKYVAIKHKQIDSGKLNELLQHNGWEALLHFIIKNKLANGTMWLARVSYYLKDKDLTMSLLEQSYAEGSLGPTRILNDVRLQFLKDDPRFKEFMHRFNL